MTGYRLYLWPADGGEPSRIEFPDFERDEVLYPANRKRAELLFQEAKIRALLCSVFTWHDPVKGDQEREEVICLK